MLFYLFHFTISFISTVLFQLYLMRPKVTCSLWFRRCSSLDNLSIHSWDGLRKSRRFFPRKFNLGLMSHTMSRRYKRPVIIFIVPGIIPLVPGGAAYEADSLLSL